MHPDFVVNIPISMFMNSNYSSLNSDLSADWSASLSDEFEQPYMRELFAFITSEVAEGKVIYPQSEKVFAALNETSLNDVRVVILGQDPYHGPQQAHGLSFSVEPGVKVPPSLLNIYKEQISDLNCSMPEHGSLISWAKQGVLLLNSVLTVEQANAGSHQGRGWERFTDRVIEVINAERKNVVFMLWGSYAQKKGQVIDATKHHVLSAPHPSPLSAYRGFFGCRHFSKANEYLVAAGYKPIDWQIT